MEVKNQNTQKKTDVAAISAVPKKTTRLPIAQVTALMVAAGPAGTTVPAMAEALTKAKYVAGAHGVERDIRLVIDRLRSQKHRIVRSALKTFTYVGAPEATAK